MYNNFRIYYLPGLYSIILIPLVMGIYLSFNIIRNTEYAIPIYFLDKDDQKDFQKLFLLNREFKSVWITGQGYNDSLSYNTIRKFARKIRMHPDSTIGVKIIFDKQIKYNNYIKTINELLIENVETYIPLEDTIFIFYKNRKDEDLSINIPGYCDFKIGFYYGDDVIYIKTADSLFGKIQIFWEENNWIYYKYRPYWSIFVVYILLSILGIRRVMYDNRKIENINNRKNER